MSRAAIEKIGLAAALTALAAAFVYTFYVNAWVVDDAYITFRSVDNWIAGRGLTWNPGERVQVFTHPLWMLLVAAAYAVTREFFYTSLALSFVASASAVSSTRSATLLCSSRYRRSRIWRLVTNLPSRPARGEVFEGEPLEGPEAAAQGSR